MGKKMKFLSSYKGSKITTFKAHPHFSSQLTKVTLSTTKHVSLAIRMLWCENLMQEIHAMCKKCSIWKRQKSVYLYYFLCPLYLYGEKNETDFKKKRGKSHEK